MSEAFFPYGRQSVDADDIQRVSAVLGSDFLTTGPEVEQFEKSLRAQTGAGYVTAVSSGTAALHVAYFAAGLGKGDKIITSPLTFASTANAALFLGAGVEFVDVDAQTGNIDPEAVEAAITSQTKLIVAVDFAGVPADYDRLNAIAKRHAIGVVSDAAHSLGATYRGRRVGTLADVTATSFHPVKPITTAEGGAVFTDNAQVHDRAQQFRHHGITRDAGQMTRNDGPWFYQQHDLGFNYRLSDVHCALGISQLGKLEGFISRRRAIAARYSAGLADIAELTLPAVPQHVESGWHLYVVRVNAPTRRLAFFQKLRELAVGVQVHYIPVYHHPYYEALGFKVGLCPIAEDFYARCLSLPIYPALSNEDVDQIIDRARRAAAAVL